MKPANLSILNVITILFVLLTVQAARGQTNGTWSNAASNSAWSTTTNWSGGIVANGIDAIADFSTLDIAANRTVNLGANRTIGSLTFGDATTPSNTWALANGAGGPWTLTLATSSSAPVIQVVNQTATISAIIGGTQGFSKTGAGTLTLSNAANTLTGGITLNAGTLNFANGSVGSNQIAFAANATLGWSAGNTQDLSAQLKIEDGVTATIATGANNVTFASALQTGAGGSASMIKTGAGILTFTAVNTYTGNTRVSGGRIVLTGGDDRLAPSGSITLGQAGASGILQLGDSSSASHQTTSSLTIAGTGSANAVVGGHTSVSTLTINNAAAVTYAGLLGGAGSNENNLALAKTGAGTLTLSNAGNTFTGDVLIAAGTVAITKSTALGSTAKTITVSGTTNAPSLKLDGTSGDLSLAADLSLITSNDNATTPAILSSAGNNTIAGSISPTTGGFGGGNTRIKVTGGTLAITGSISPATTASGSVSVIFDSATGTSGSSSGILSDGAAATLAVTKATGGPWAISGANTYTGLTTISAGTLQVSSIAANGTAQPLGTATSAILIGTNTTVGTLEYTGTTAATLGRSITVNGSAGAIVKNSGGATLTLSAIQARGARALTYTGGDFVISGRITGASTTAPLLIDNATVRLTHNNNSYISPTVVQNNSTLIVANTTASSSATGTGSVSVDAISKLAGTGFINAGADNSITINGSLSIGDPSLSTVANLDLTTSGTGSTILGAGSVLLIDLFSGAGLGDSSANASAADQLRLFGALGIAAGATLKLGNPNNLSAWTEGDIFKLFDWAGTTSVSGSLAIDSSDVNLPTGLIWDTSNLYSAGTIRVGTSIIPEPSRGLLLLLGATSLVWRRRRS